MHHTLLHSSIIPNPHPINFGRIRALHSRIKIGIHNDRQLLFYVRESYTESNRVSTDRV